MTNNERDRAADRDRGGGEGPALATGAQRQPPAATRRRTASTLSTAASRRRTPATAMAADRRQAQPGARERSRTGAVGLQREERRTVQQAQREHVTPVHTP